MERKRYQLTMLNKKSRGPNMVLECIFSCFSLGRLGLGEPTVFEPTLINTGRSLAHMQSTDAYQERFPPLCTWMPPATKLFGVVRNERILAAFALVNCNGLKVKQHPRRLKSVDSRKPPKHPLFIRLTGSDRLVWPATPCPAGARLWAPETVAAP